MANKVKIIDGQGTQVFPITHVSAVIDSNGNSVEQVLGAQTDLIHQAQLEIGAVPSDLVPTKGSSNWVTSNGVFGATNIIMETFDLESAAATTNNENYITPSITVDGAKWTIKKVAADTARQAQISIPRLTQGKKYHISFDFVNTINATITVALDYYYNTGTGTTAITTGRREELSSSLTADGNTGSFDATVIAEYSDIDYLCFRFPQPTIDQYLQISDLSVEEVTELKEEVTELKETVEGLNVPALYDGFGLNADGAISQNALFYELNAFSSIPFPAVRTGRKVDGTNGKWSAGDTHKYYLFPVEAGQVYRIVANSEHYANYAWFAEIPESQTSGGTPPYISGESNQYRVNAGETADVQVPTGTHYMYIFGALSTGDNYAPSSISLAISVVSRSSARLNAIEKGTPYTLQRLLKLARYRRDDTDNISILHYSDLHADAVAFAELQEFYNEYGDKFDAILETGDRTYTVASGTAPNLADEVLFVPGNHDVCNGSGTAGYSWPAYTPEYLFNKFVAPYKDARGITLPEGWNVEGDPHQNPLYWYKDFDNGLDKVRLIGIDCMRYYHMNENDSEFDNDAQEKWLCDTLADAQANGFKVIVASHYSLDDYSGAYAKWDEENHTWKYNYVNDPVSNTGGHVMNRMTNTPVGFHNRTTTSFTSSNTQHLRNRTAKNNKGNTNNFGDIITAWIEGGSAFNNYITFPGGGTFIAWICGHLHNNIMFYPTRYPKILNIVTTCVGTTMWGYDTNTPTVNRREDTVYHRLSANAYFIQGNYLKIVRIGNNLTNDLLVPSTWMTINYVTGEVITEG